MKNFFKIALQFKMNLCLFFAGTAIVMLIICFFTGVTEITTAFLWQTFLICFVGVLIQMIAFSDLIIKKMKFLWRSIIFIVPFLSFLSGCAVWFQWFPTDVIGYWITFCVIFFVIFAVIAGVFEMYYCVTGEHINKSLEDYKNKNR